MIFLLRYLDKFSARAGIHNWVVDPQHYTDNDVHQRLEELQSLGYLVEMTFVEQKNIDNNPSLIKELEKIQKEVDLNPTI